MEIHVYLHRNGGFPNIHKNCLMKFTEANQVLEIRNEGGEEDYEIVREYDVDKIFRVDILMPEEE